MRKYKKEYESPGCGLTRLDTEESRGFLVNYKALEEGRRDIVDERFRTIFNGGPYVRNTGR